MDWDTYYERFYDWAQSTRISRISSLTSFGASSEVAEAAQELMDEKAASRLIRKAVEQGVQFTPREIYDLSGCCDTSAMNALLASSKCRLTRDQLEELCGAVDDNVLEQVASRNHVTLFEDEMEDDEEDKEEPDFDEEYGEEPAEPDFAPGFFTRLLMATGLAGLLSSEPRQHPGRCTGDCAHCPPHYGYRYGRWYYGHGHQYGCEFEGNGGASGRTTRN